MASKSASASGEDARKAAAGPKGQGTKRVEIGGKEFWKSESQEKSQAGKMRNVTYATGLSGYVLEFHIMSFDARLTDELQHSIESISFFDPAQVGDVAGPDSRPYRPAGNLAPVPSSSRVPNLEPGKVTGNIYSNDELAFSYEFPMGWTVADRATQEKVVEAGHQAAWGESSAAAREHQAAQQCTRTLLWVSKYQEGTKTEGVNPLIVVMAVDPACVPGAHFPASPDDRGGIGQLAEQVVRSFAGTPFIAKGQSSVRPFTVQGHLMLDISGVSTVSFAGHKSPLNIFTSFIFTAPKDYWVAWVLMSSSQAGLEELKKNRVTFNSSPQSTPTVQRQ
jgi:hypothetical protein